MHSISIECKECLWCNHPGYAEYTKIKEEAQEPCQNGDFRDEKYKKFANWNPILNDSNRNFQELEKHFHPAIVRDNRMFKINMVGVNILNTPFTWEPEVEEGLENKALVGQFVTFHANGSPLFFKPTVHQVLTQLPQEIIELEGDFYFTTEVIAEDVNKCSVGHFNKYHVAVTSVYRD